MKKFLVVISSLLLVLALFPGISKAEKFDGQTGETISVNEVTYGKLLDLGIIDKNISYDEWSKANDESAFDELDNDFPILNTEFIADASGSQTLAAGTFTLKLGDILISNGTSSLGLTGHAGIVVAKNKVLQIAGYGYKPKIYKISTWQKRYGLVKGQKDGITRTKVYRISSTAKAKKAAKWANTNYKGKKYSYGLRGSITSKNPTYCSKIVWQAYHSKGINLVKKPSGLALPYSLPKYFKKSAKVKGIGIL